VVWPLGRELYLWHLAVLRGLRALNLTMNEPWLIKARDCWRAFNTTTTAGASAATPTTTGFQRPGPSTASQTAWRSWPLHVR